MIGRSIIRQILFAGFALAIGAQAHAEILALDCSDAHGVYYNIWVDLDRSTITLHYARPDLSQDLRTYPAQITPTTIHWNFGGSSRVTLNATIDRKTGRYVQVYGGVARGSGTFQCERGTTPYPGARF